jgi:V-type H+-transporting ATPase subunit a
MLEICFGGRYLLLVMSLFAIYCGFLYNECFALPMALFPSNWAYPDPPTEGALAIRTSTDYVYPFGVDPLWKGAGNELDYYNSLKMKMSVIMGVVQMTLGIVLSLFNHLHFKKPYNIIFEFFPQIIFLSAIFGYMDVLIVFKWLKDWSQGDYPPTDAHLVPRLLNVMIQMLLSPWSVPDDYKMYPGQLYVQLTLVIVAVICVPLMLLPKPFLLRRDAMKAKEYTRIETAEDHDDHHEEEFNFSEVFIHQVIHTIEFVLGSVSNTASYLRLWALSLAHAGM